MTTQKKETNWQIWKAATIVLAALLLLVCCLTAFSGKSAAPAPASEPETAAEPAAAEGSDETPAVANDSSILSSWAEDSKAREELVAFVEAAVDENSAGFIPVANRIAVFDLDGTLFCETDPVYFDYCLLRHRVLEDPDYIDRASDFEKETVEKINTMIETGKSAEGLEVDHGRCIASAFAGMTVDEFHQYVLDFRNEPAPGYNNMRRGEAFYIPMKEVVRYLQANDFTVYVVSGTDRLIVRGICDGTLDLPMGQIIGSDETIVASTDTEADGLNYQYKEGDDLILGGEFIVKNLKMNKVKVIAQEIGVKPVLSFGNSSGDSSMDEYTILNNPYPAKAFMLCCDDTERENGNLKKAEDMEAMCAENGWVPVSMKNDWKTIYGDNVTRKKD